MCPTPALDRLLELGLGLVVAVHVDPPGVEPGAQREVELAAGRDVPGEPLFGEQAQGRGAGEGLAGEEDLEVVGASAKAASVGAGSARMSSSA